MIPKKYIQKYVRSSRQKFHFCYHTEKNNDDKDTPNTLIENNAFVEMLYKKTLEQAEEIGQLRERISQMQQRFEKDAANASTDTIANLGEYSPINNYTQDYIQHYTQPQFFKRNVPFSLLPYPTILRHTPIISENPFNRQLNTH